MSYRGIENLWNNGPMLINDIEFKSDSSFILNDKEFPFTSNTGIIRDIEKSYELLHYFIPKKCETSSNNLFNDYNDIDVSKSVLVLNGKDPLKNYGLFSMNTFADDATIKSRVIIYE